MAVLGAGWLAWPRLRDFNTILEQPRELAWGGLLVRVEAGDRLVPQSQTHTLTVLRPRAGEVDAPLALHFEDVARSGRDAYAALERKCGAAAPCTASRQAGQEPAVDCLSTADRRPGMILVACRVPGQPIQAYYQGPESEWPSLRLIAERAFATLSTARDSAA